MKFKSDPECQRTFNVCWNYDGGIFVVRERTLPVWKAMTLCESLVAVQLRG